MIIEAHDVFTVGMKEPNNDHSEAAQWVYITHCGVYKNHHEQMTREGKYIMNNHIMNYLKSISKIIILNS